MEENSNKGIAIVYLLGGLSSRFGGKIKALIQVGPENETLLEYSLKQALNAGFSKIIFIVSQKTEQAFKQAFGNSYNNIPIHYAMQEHDESKRDKPWGTTDAICSARHLIDCPFVICNGDNLYGEQGFKLLFNHLQNKDSAAAVGIRLANHIPGTGTVNRGIFKVNEQNQVLDLVETFNIEKDKLDQKGLTLDSFSAMNLFALSNNTLDLLYDELKLFKQLFRHERKTECIIPIELSKLIKDNKIKMQLYPIEGKILGITNPGDEELVREELEENTL